VEVQVRDQRIPEKDRRELLKRYNRDLPQEEQMSWEVSTTEGVSQTTDPGVSDTNYAQFWTAGKFGDPQRNADGHFEKHILGQREFSGRYRSVAEYTKGALEFASRTGLVEDMQPGGNWGKYFYDMDSRRGEMVVLNGENGRLASYYELRGSIDEVSRYIQEKLKASSWMEVKAKLLEASSPLTPPVPMVVTQTASSPIPIPARTNTSTVDRYGATPPEPPLGGWPDTPPSSPRGSNYP
jgi:hypothetical protein